MLRPQITCAPERERPTALTVRLFKRRQWLLSINLTFLLSLSGKKRTDVVLAEIQREEEDGTVTFYLKIDLLVLVACSRGQLLLDRRRRRHSRLWLCRPSLRPSVR